MANGAEVRLSSVQVPAQRLYRGPLHCCSSILQSEGLQGLYRGAGAMILRDVPGYVLYFIPYTAFCNLLKVDGSSSPHACSIWLAGGLAGKKCGVCVCEAPAGMNGSTLIDHADRRQRPLQDQDQDQP